MAELRKFSDDHPANYDQQVEIARELLGKSDAWLLINYESTPEVEEGTLHGMLGATPGTDLVGFMYAAVKVFSTIVKETLTEDSPEETENE